MKCKTKISLFCIMLVLFTALLSGCSKKETAFTINGLEVERSELLYYMRENVSIVTTQLEEMGLNTDGDDFWTVSQNGIIPFDYLQDYTVKEISHVKIEQMCAREYGIETPLYYSEQQKAYEEQNKKRLADYEAGKVLYGPIERDFVTYFNEWYLSMQDSLMAKLEKADILRVNDRQIEDYYIANTEYFADVSYEVAEAEIKKQLLQTAYSDYINAKSAEADIVRVKSAKQSEVL